MNIINPTNWLKMRQFRNRGNKLFFDLSSLNQVYFLVILLFLIPIVSIAQHDLNHILIGKTLETSKSSKFELKSNLSQEFSGVTLNSDRFRLKTGFWKENTDLIFKNNLD